IYHPQSGILPGAGIPTIALYLPRGSLLHDAENDTTNAQTLRSSLPWTVVRLNYRLSQAHPYPAPIHDVLAGYDWILEHLLPKRSIARPGRSARVGQLAVFGELIGGGLASMLALTECRRAEAGVVAAAVSNPLVDWVFPQEGEAGYAKSSMVKAGSHHPGLTVSNLHNARSGLFRKPADYFDPFASPMLLFRTAGTEPPMPITPLVTDELEQLSLLDREDFFREQQLLSGISNAPPTSLPELVSQPSIIKRKTSRMFPSKDLKLTLPSFYISTGNKSPLLDQAKELSSALRKSVIRQHRARKPGGDFGRKVLTEEEELEQLEPEERVAKVHEDDLAAEQVNFESVKGLGLWDGSTAGTARLLEAAAWAREKLR
ncbi:hypothetical protein LTR95_017027, partial [Oleoguttula sp. CCFEE 5521]